MRAMLYDIVLQIMKHQNIRCCDSEKDGTRRRYNMAYELQEARELVIRAGLELLESGLIARTWGNISAAGSF